MSQASWNTRRDQPSAPEQPPVAIAPPTAVEAVAQDAVWTWQSAGGPVWGPPVLVLALLAGCLVLWWKRQRRS